MSAPFFYTPASLRSDLELLGYPLAANQESFSPSGEARLNTLSWLAAQVDPTFTNTNPADLAAFWDRLGAHSHSPNKAGVRIPFTASTDRPRDKHAANMYLRTCIDLTIAFRNIREGEPPSWLSSDLQDSGCDSIDQDASLFSESDLSCMSQLDHLIANRHQLFPNTICILEVSQKKRPLVQRKPTFSTNRIPKPAACKPSKKKTAQSAMSGENLLKRLRDLQRDTAELEASRQSPRETAPVTGKAFETGNVSQESISCIAKESRIVTNLATRFSAMADARASPSSATSNIATRDEAEEQLMSQLATECSTLHRQIHCMLRGVSIVRTALERLRNYGRLLATTPNSAVVATVAEQRRRTRNHM